MFVKELMAVWVARIPIKHTCETFASAQHTYKYKLSHNDLIVRTIFILFLMCAPQFFSDGAAPSVRLLGSRKLCDILINGRCVRPGCGLRGARARQFIRMIVSNIGVNACTRAARICASQTLGALLVDDLICTHYGRGSRESCPSDWNIQFKVILSGLQVQHKWTPWIACREREVHQAQAAATVRGVINQNNQSIERRRSDRWFATTSTTRTHHAMIASLWLCRICAHLCAVASSSVWPSHAQHANNSCVRYSNMYRLTQTTRLV